MMMDYKWTVSWILMAIRTGDGLKCFECNNQVNPACGVEFEFYQYKANQCEGDRVKCGLQRQEPLPEKDNSVGVVRGCYYLGQLPNIDESDGCHFTKIPPQNITIELCFCSEDYCNAAHRHSTCMDTIIVLLSVCIYVYLRITY